MGRKKLKIQRLECVKGRQAKYSKRKIGLLKKAKDLAILCDVDLTLLMFSPTGKPSLYVGQDKDLSNVLEKLSAFTLEEREERRNYTKKIIKKMYTTDDLEATPNNFLIDREEAFQIELQELKEKLGTKRKILRDWTNPESVNDLKQVKIMEEHLIATLTRIESKKIELQKEGTSYEAYLYQGAEGLANQDATWTLHVVSP